MRAQYSRTTYNNRSENRNAEVERVAADDGHNPFLSFHLDSICDASLLCSMHNRSRAARFAASSIEGQRFPQLRSSRRFVGGFVLSGTHLTHCGIV